MRWIRIQATIAILIQALASQSYADDTIYQSTPGLCFKIQSEFLPNIKELITKVRKEINDAIGAGKYVAYLSVPISPTGGGKFETNNAISEFVSKGLLARFGKKLWVLNPASFVLPNVGASKAGGGEYMAVWSDVLGSESGDGKQFDMIYFVGPRDLWGYFGADDQDKLGDIERWVEELASRDETFKKYILEGDNRRNFIRYYGLRAAATYSKGAHDEWNILAALNAKRGIGNDIAVFFDGTAINPGDFLQVTDSGYAIGCK